MSATTTIARIWAIARRDGLTLGFTDHDGALEADGTRFRPDPGLSARAIVQAAGLSVDNTEAEGALTDDAISERDLMAGLWDGAELRMWEVDWTAPASRRLIFLGNLGEVSRSNGAFRAELQGIGAALNTAQGRVYHPRCAARLGSAQCRVALTEPAFTVTVTLEGPTDGRIFRLAEIGGYDDGWFDRGEVVVLTGAAQGLRGRIKNDLVQPGAPRRIELWETLGILPGAGDQMRLIAGCDKSARTCRLKFANFLNFRGFPHLPTEDWLMAPQAGTSRG